MIGLPSLLGIVARAVGQGTATGFSGVRDIIGSNVVRNVGGSLFDVSEANRVPVLRNLRRGFGSLLYRPQNETSSFSQRNARREERRRDRGERRIRRDQGRSEDQILREERARQNRLDAMDRASALRDERESANERAIQESRNSILENIRGGITSIGVAAAAGAATTKTLAQKVEQAAGKSDGTLKTLIMGSIGRGIVFWNQAKDTFNNYFGDKDKRYETPVDELDKTINERIVRGNNSETLETATTETLKNIKNELNVANTLDTSDEEFLKRREVLRRIDERISAIKLEEFLRGKTDKNAAYSHSTTKEGTKFTQENIERDYLESKVPRNLLGNVFMDNNKNTSSQQNEQTTNNFIKSNLTVSPKGLSLIRGRHEGFSPKAYKDIGGVWTIGYGSTMYADGTKVKRGDTITKSEAKELMEIDIQRKMSQVEKMVKVPLTQNQVDSLGSFVYNVGVKAFKESTMLEKINEGKFDEVGPEFERWKHVNGVEVRGLSNRRKEERRLFESPPKPLKFEAAKAVSEKTLKNIENNRMDNLKVVELPTTPSGSQGRMVPVNSGGGLQGPIVNIDPESSLQRVNSGILKAGTI